MSSNDNKDGSKLNWMYQGVQGMVSREDYLLGRKIDATFDHLVAEESGAAEEGEPSKPVYIIEHEVAPKRVLEGREKQVQVDLQRKLREDPMFLIRKTEEETRKSITSNPIKMKRLQEMITDVKSKSPKKKKKKEKSSKRHKDRDDKHKKDRLHKRKKEKKKKKLK